MCVPAAGAILAVCACFCCDFLLLCCATHTRVADAEDYRFAACEFCSDCCLLIEKERPRLGEREFLLWILQPPFVFLLQEIEREITHIRKREIGRNVYCLVVCSCEILLVPF